MSPSRRFRRLYASLSALLAPLAFVVALSCPGAAIMVGSRHDFVDNGYSGGVCDECHVPHYADASAGRLYPRPVGGAALPARLCMDCHDGSMPAGFPGGLVPAPLPVRHNGGTGSFADCTVCHSHALEFVVPNTDCLGGGGGIPCHATIASAVAPLHQPFYGLTTASVGSTNIISQHNIRYQEDGNFATIETTSLNECKKCHPKGMSHPKQSAFLESPMGTIFPRVTTTGTAGYQAFCLACHDSTSGGLENNQFRGNIPAQQAQPSDPNAGALPWRVPYVPRRVVAGCDSQNASTPPSAPYFSFYEVNGHGAPLSIHNAVMDLTCMSVSTFTPTGAAGCHNAHSATNRMLVAESIGTGTVGLRSSQDFQLRVCGTCHDPAVIAMVGSSQFHGGWSGRGSMSHTDPITTSGDMVALQLWAENMNITGTWTYDASVLPLWNPPSSQPIEDRGTKTIGDLVHCLTCHDPHGTASVRQEYKESVATPGLCNTQAMLRKFPKVWNYTDPLCGECHSE